MSNDIFKKKLIFFHIKKKTIVGYACPTELSWTF